MPMKKAEFETQIKQALSEKPELPDELEAVLFSRAEDLLSKRREQIAARDAEAHKSRLTRKRWIEDIQRLFSRASEVLALYPDRPATAAVLALLIAAFLALHGGRRDMSEPLSYADLPPLPKNNDFPARYDAQIHAERQAYEREVQDAHKSTSGGI